MTIPTIDPVKVREARQRNQAELDRVEQQIRAADALLWFSEYGHPTRRVEDVIRGTLTVTASATPNAAVAQRYVTQATQRALPNILEDAIEMAKRDFERAEP